MGIGGISSAYGAYAMYRTQPMSYAVQNEADVSDAYKESMGVGRARSLDPTPPVLYPNAQRSQVAGASRPADEQTVNRQFNSIAERYTGNNIGYDRGAQGQSYSVTGSMFDARV